MYVNLADGVTMRYVDLCPQAPADAVPVLLLHGFGSNFAMNWRATGWTQTFDAAGLRVLGPDLRGHGGSGKPAGEEAYLPVRFVADLLAMLDELEVEQVDVVGYSMGSRLVWEWALRAPERLRSVVLGGFGSGDAFQDTDLSDPGRGDTPFDHAFRTVSTLPGNDAAALVDCARGQASCPFRPDPPVTGLPLMTIAGSQDVLATGAEKLAEICGGHYVEVPARDHTSAVSSRVFKQAVLDFLTQP